MNPGAAAFAPHPNQSGYVSTLHSGLADHQTISRDVLLHQLVVLARWNTSYRSIDTEQNGLLPSEHVLRRRHSPRSGSLFCEQVVVGQEGKDQMGLGILGCTALHVSIVPIQNATSGDGRCAVIDSNNALTAAVNNIMRIPPPVVS